jgi:hypothetical protein
MINSTPFALNVAFEGKGTVFFNSKTIMGSTNIANTGILSAKMQIGLTDTSAFIRRITIGLHKNEKLINNFYTGKYRVDILKYTELHKEYLNKWITPYEVVILIRKCKAISERETKSYDFTPEMLKELYKDTQGFQTQAATAVNSEHFFTQMIKYGIYSWWDSPYRDIYIALFFFLMNFIVASYMFNFFKTTFTEESFDHKMKHGSKSQVDVKKRVRKLVKMLHFRTQANEDNYSLSLEKTLSKGIIHLTIKAFNGNQVVRIKHTNSFHVRDRYVCCPYHFIATLLDYDLDHKIVLIANVNGKDNEIPFLESNFQRIEGVDLVIFSLPTTIPQPLGLYNYLQDDKEFVLHSGYGLRIVTKDFQGHLEIGSMCVGTSNTTIRYVVDSYIDEDDKLQEDTIIMNSYIPYPAVTKAGNSGAPVFIEGNNGKAVLIGLHIGISTTIGKSTSIALKINKGFFDEILPTVKLQAADVIFPLNVIKVVDRGCHISRRSKIRQSWFHGWDGLPEQIPARLGKFESNGITIDPLINATLKLHQVPTPPTYLPSFLMEELFSYYPRNNGKVISWEQCINGDSQIGMTGITSATSCGYPYNLHSTHGKFPYIVRKPDNTLDYSPEFLEELIEHQKCLQKGQQIEVLWADTLKDETRLISKVEEGKTRLFTTCPLHYLFLVRLYFLDFVTYVQSQASRKPVSVGLNAHSLEWTEIFTRLNQTSKSVIAGDFTNYDGKLPKFVGEFFLQFVNEWYNDGETNANIRKLLFYHITDATHISNCYVYQVVDGNPSGNPITSIYNSFANIIMCMTILHEDLCLCSDEYTLVVYGDDNVITINRPGYKASDLTNYFKDRFGLVYTHFSKEESDTNDTLLDIRYLGRAFVYSDGVYHAPLKIKVIVEATYWFKSTTSPQEIVLSTAESFFLELSHHGPQVFREYSEKYLKAVKNSLHGELYDAISQRQKTYSFYREAMYVNPRKFILGKSNFTGV